MPLYIAPLCSPEILPVMEQDAMRLKLSELPRLHDNRGTLYGSASFWQNWVTAVGWPAGEPAQEMHFTHAMLALSAAADKLGVVVTTPVLAEAFLRDGRLYLPFKEQVKIDKSYYLVTDTSAEKNSRIAVFAQWLRDEAEHSRSALVPHA
jgi:DNA-binding transcriptional LysR family regulator